MADKGPGPDDLIRKRITAEIKRLEYQIESQELEILELDERQARLRENVKASGEEIDKQHGNLTALDNGNAGKDESDG